MVYYGLLGLSTCTPSSSRTQARAALHSPTSRCRYAPPVHPQRILGCSIGRGRGPLLLGGLGPFQTLSCLRDVKRVLSPLWIRFQKRSRRRSGPTSTSLFVTSLFETAYEQYCAALSLLQRQESNRQGGRWFLL